jgi:hypothetical protein
MWTFQNVKCEPPNDDFNYDKVAIKCYYYINVFKPIKKSSINLIVT